MKLVELDSISFGYTNTQMVLSDVSLCIEKGKKYALIGPTGQGKSTTANLIAGLIQPTKGVVLYKGTSVSEWDQHLLFKEVGYILQEPFVFSGTILDNMVYGNELYKKYADIKGKSNEKELLQEFRNVVCEQYDIDELLPLFPTGLLTDVTNATEDLSLGQKQILNFIRVVLRKPELLILDEATANLDTVTEQTLQKILHSLPSSTTIITIAHRLYTVKDADTVFLVGGGSIEETTL